MLHQSISQDSTAAKSLSHCGTRLNHVPGILIEKDDVPHRTDRPYLSSQAETHNRGPVGNNQGPETPGSSHDRRPKIVVD